jgi:hypothetical protein
MTQVAVIICHPDKKGQVLVPCINATSEIDRNDDEIIFAIRVALPEAALVF